MKIIVFFTYGISLKIWEETGLLEREIKIYQELKKKYGIDFTFVTYGDEEDFKYKNLIDDLEIIPIYNLIKYSNNKLIRLFKSVLFPIKLNNLIPKRNYILKTNQMYGAWVAIIFKILTNHPLIIRTGYDLVSFSLKQSKNIFKLTIYYILTFIALNISDVYISTSKKDIEFLRKFFIFKSKKLIYIPNWVQIKDLVPVNQRKKKILTVGRLEKQKNFKYLIEKFKHSDIKLDIYGDGSEKKDLIKLSGQKNNISFKGTLPNNELIAKYSEYQIFVSTSDYEGNSKTILESMGAGCIVVAPNIKNNSEIIINNLNGILYDKSYDDLLNIVITLLSNPKKMDLISKEANKNIRNNNSLEKITMMENDCYQMLLNKL